MKIETKKIDIEFSKRKVIAQKLEITSELHINIEDAWKKVKTSELFEFVSKGKLKFKPVEGKFPKIWKEGSRVETKLFLFGFIPFGGIHTLKFTQIDNKKKVLKTEESNSFTKVWNHEISLGSKGDDLISYKDEIIIYGGVLTQLISYWALSFYKHRQQRWILVAQDILATDKEKLSNSSGNVT